MTPAEREQLDSLESIADSLKGIRIWLMFIYIGIIFLPLFFKVWFL